MEPVTIPGQVQSHETRGRRLEGGFSLIEVMAVVLVTAVLLSLSGPVLSGLFGGRFTQSVITLSGALERARQYAITTSTYTYVGLTDSDSKGQIFLGVIGSGSGFSGIGSSLADEHSADIGIPGAVDANNPLILLDKIAKLENCELENEIPSGNGLRGDPRLTGNAESLSDSVKLTYSRGNDDLVFTRLIQFTPTGGARVSRVTPESIDLVVVPTKGDPQNPVSQDVGACVVRVAGLTGQVNVYRP